MLFYNIHNIIHVETNEKVAFIPDYFKTQRGSNNNVIIYELANNLQTDPSKLNQLGLRIFYDIYDEYAKIIHRTYTYIPLQMEIKYGLKEKRTLIRFNRLYKAFRNPADFLKAILQMRLLEEKYALVHGAAVYNEENDIALLLPAHSDTGKTHTAIKLIQAGWCFMGDDVIISNGEDILCYPLPVYRILRGPFRKIPFLRRLEIKKRIEIPKIKEKTNIDTICLLETSKDYKVSEIDERELIIKMELVTENALSLFPFPQGVMHGLYYVMGWSLDRYINRRREIIKRIVKNARATYVIKGNHEDFYKGVLQILKR